MSKESETREYSEGSEDEEDEDAFMDYEGRTITAKGEEVQLRVTNPWTLDEISFVFRSIERVREM